eukprot:3785091-Rhodomonas_salina.2
MRWPRGGSLRRHPMVSPHFWKPPTLTPPPICLHCNTCSPRATRSVSRYALLARCAEARRTACREE